MLVRDLSEQRQIKSRETVDAIRSAAGKNRVAGPLHVIAARIVPGKFECKVGFDTGADLEFTAGIQRPATVGKLLLNKVASGLLSQFRLFSIELSE